MQEINNVVFVPDGDSSRQLFEQHMKDTCDYPHVLYRGNFYFRVPDTMSVDELTSYLDGLLKHQDDITGDFGAVVCQTPEEVLLSLEDLNADDCLYGSYYVRNQIDSHSEYSETEEEIQNDQIGREEQMTLKFIHRTPKMIELLRKALREKPSKMLQIEIESLLTDLEVSFENG
jgi:hypothetical protein